MPDTATAPAVRTSSARTRTASAVAGQGSAAPAEGSPGPDSGATGQGAAGKSAGAKTSAAKTSAAKTSAAKTSAAKNSAARSPSAARRTLRREAFGMTDVGLVREGNEDALLLLEDENLYVVADGMGGHACGEVASAFTIEAIRAFYHSQDITRRVKAAYRRGRPALRDQATSPAVREASFHALRLRKAVESANISVYRLAQQHEQLRDMGTTVVACSFVGRKLYVANVGDSRVYRLRKGQLTQITEDHSLLNEYIKMNLLQPEEIETFPYKNVIVRALGLQDSVAVDVFSSTVALGDQFLLCTDGLTDLVRDAEIGAVLNDAPTAEAACHQLTELAKDRGGHDNITTLVVRIHDAATLPVRAAPPPPPPGPAPVGMPPPGPAPMAIPPPPQGPAPVGGGPGR